MTDNYSNQTRAPLDLLNRLPAKPRVTFHGYVGRTADRVWIVGSPTLTTTTYSLEIVTNNLARPEVAIVVSASGRDLISILQGAPSLNLQEVTCLPNPYFLRHITHEYNDVAIQVYEEIVLSSQPAGFIVTHPLHTQDLVLAVLDPALRAARGRPLLMPEGSSDRFLESIH